VIKLGDGDKHRLEIGQIEYFEFNRLSSSKIELLYAWGTKRPEKGNFEKNLVRKQIANFEGDLEGELFP